MRGWLGFGLGALEEAFRAATLRSDLVRARVAVACSAMAFVLIGGADVLVAGPLALASGRLIVLAGLGLVSMAVVVHLPRVSRPATVDTVLAGWQVVMAFTALVYRATESLVVNQATIAVMTVAIYALLPCALRYRAFSAVLLTGLDLLIESSVLGASSGRLFGILVAYALAHVAGVASAAGFLAMRRRHFLADRGEREARRALELQVNTDGLTDAIRRGRWLELAEQEVSRFHRHQRPFAVLIADLDHFKRVNDSHGHLAGDEVLRQFADLLRRESRQFDLVGRLGGEEFGILLPETDLASAREVAWRIVQACRALTVTLPEAQVRLTCSIGVTVVEAGDRFIAELLARADAAMYAAKAAGRDRVEVASRMAELPPPS